MAEVMNSLFGVTPESLMAQRNNALQAQALQYAQLDPFQRATAGIYAGANQLGGAVGGMLGAQDPEMQRVTQRQSMLQQAQPTDAKSWGALASQLMQSGDIQGAQEAYAKSQSLQSLAIKQGLDTSTMASNLATAAGKQFDISPQGRGQELAKTGKFTSPSIKNFIEGTGQLEVIDKFAKPSADFIAKAVELNFGDKPAYGDYSAEQAGKVNAALFAESLKLKKAGKTDIVLPGVAKAGDVTGLRKDLQAITKPYQDQADSAGDAIDLANMAIKNNNFAAVSSLSRSLAKAAGETQLSRNDVEAFGIDPSLVGSVSDTVSRLAQGRPTVDTLTKLRQLAEALKKKAESRLSIEEQQLQDTARVSGLFTEPQIETVFRRRPKEAGKTSFNSVADAEAAKLPKGTIITINGRRARVE